MAGVAFLQLEQRLRPADLVEKAVAPQLVGNGDRVDRLAVGHQAADGGVDVLVPWFVEVVDADAELADLIDDVTRQQQRAQQALLRIEVVRRNDRLSDRRGLRSRPESREKSVMGHLPCLNEPVGRKSNNL